MEKNLKLNERAFKAGITLYKSPPQCHLLSNEWIPVQPWGFAQQSTQTRVLEGVMLSGWCWMKSCCPCALLLPSSASDMRWHSSPSRDALEVTVCLGEIIKKKQSKKPTKQNKKSSNAWKMSRDYCKSCFGDVWDQQDVCGCGRSGLFVGFTLLNSLWATGWCFPWFPSDSPMVLRLAWCQLQLTFSCMNSTMPQPLSCSFYCKENLARTAHPWLPVSCLTKIKAPAHW